MSAEFREFYLSSVRSLTGWFYKMGFRAPDLDDLVQDSYLEAFRNFKQLRSPGAARSWLFVIGRRQVAKRLRDGKVDFETLDDDWQSVAEDQVDCAEIIDNQLACRRIIIGLTAVRPARKRQALVDFFIEEKSLQEISKKYRIRVSTLTTWCHRFRSECRQRQQIYESEVTISSCERIPT